MNQKMNFIPLFLGVAFMAHGVAYAGSCASVEREMVQGQTAVEFAKDKNGYQKAVRLFEEATEKAPDCANAYYNLGLVYEKTTNYAKAKKSLEKYLQLSPKAKDAAVVRKQIYRLEFLADNKTNETSNPWKKLNGEWCRIGESELECNGTKRFHYNLHNRTYWDDTTISPFQITVVNDTIKIIRSRKVISSQDPPQCISRGYQKFEGSIDADGQIRGDYVKQNMVDGPCSNGDITRQKRSFTGHVRSNSELIEITVSAPPGYHRGQDTGFTYRLVRH